MLKLKCQGKKLQLQADGLWKSTPPKKNRKSRSFGSLKGLVTSNFVFWHNPLLLHEERWKKSEWKLWPGRSRWLVWKCAAVLDVWRFYVKWQGGSEGCSSLRSGWKWESKEPTTRCRIPHSSQRLHSTVNQPSLYPIWSASLHLQPPVLSPRSSVLCWYLFDSAAWAARFLCTTRLHAVKSALFLCVMTSTHPGSRGENLRNMSTRRRKRSPFHGKGGTRSWPRQRRSRKCRARPAYVGQLCQLYPHRPPLPPHPASTSCPHPSMHPRSRAALRLFQSTSAGLDANGLP